MKWKNLTLLFKLITLFLLIGIIPVAFFGFWTINNTTNQLLEARFNQLDSIREIKKTQLESYFGERMGDMQVLSDLITTYKDSAEEEIRIITELKQHYLEQYFKGRSDLGRPDWTDKEYKENVHRITLNRLGLGETGATYIAFEARGRYFLGSDTEVLGSGKFMIVMTLPK
jgi:hypothetical protein